MGNARRIAWVVAVVFAAVMLVGAMAAQAADETAKIGVVDTDKIYKEAPRVKQYTEELNVRKNELAMKLEVRSKNLMLSEEEIKELVDLKVKGNTATDQEKNRIKALEDAESKRSEELTTLQNTTNLNDQQKARVTELMEMQKKSKETGNALTRDYESQLQSKMQELSDKADADVLDAIKKIAEAKGLTMVMVKAALLYGGTDITDEVIGKLDRKVN